MARIVFDTSVLVAATNKERRYLEVKENVEKVRNGGDIGLISAVTICELFAKFTKGDDRTIAMKALDYLKRSCFVVLDVNEEIAKLSGPLKARFPQLSTADAIIISTAYANDAKLYTFDKGFYGIGGVDIIGI
jgi:predicted nucleic acid-binding protein